jgi:hypothetical protein
MSEIFFGKSKSLDRFLQWTADHKVALHYMRRQAGTSAGFPFARERTECVPIQPELISP